MQSMTVSASPIRHRGRHALRPLAVALLLGLPALAAAQSPRPAETPAPAQPTSPAQPSQASAGNSGAPQPAASEYSLWETVVRVDRFMTRDPKPDATDRKKYTECLRPQDFKASALLARSPLTQDLANKCWVASQREEARRSQVKWGCKDGTTAEIATRTENENRLGYQMVINSPDAGGLSIRAESIRIAPTCEPAAR